MFVMKAGDLVKFTLGKGSSYNKDGRHHIGILLQREDSPVCSWIIFLQDGSLMHGDESEIEVISESR